MDKIKHYIESDRGKDVLTVLIVILVGLGSFGLGRLSKGGESARMRIEYPEGLVSQQANAISALNISNNQENSTTDNFFASSRGTKYYPVTCSAGKSIKLENRVYFNSNEEAEKAGYELSSSCK